MCVGTSYGRSSQVTRSVSLLTLLLPSYHFLSPLIPSNALYHPIHHFTNSPVTAFSRPLIPSQRRGTEERRRAFYSANPGVAMNSTSSRGSALSRRGEGEEVNEQTDKTDDDVAQTSVYEKRLDSASGPSST